MMVDPHHSPIGIKVVCATPGSKSPRKPSAPCLVKSKYLHGASLLDSDWMCMYYWFNTHFEGAGMRTNIVIDDELMNEAMTLCQLKTKKTVVETALRLLVQIKKQERIKHFRGKLKWDGDLDLMRLDQ